MAKTLKNSEKNVLEVFLLKIAENEFKYDVENVKIRFSKFCGPRLPLINLPKMESPTLFFKASFLRFTY